MAATDLGTQLTEQHRSAQLQLRAQALRDFAVIWPLWAAADEADSKGFAALVAASIPLVSTYRQLSAALGGAYYTEFRAAEGLDTPFAPVFAGTLDDAQLSASLRVTGSTMQRNAIQAGQSLSVARDSSLVRTSGAITRHVLNGGRDTILQSVQADPKARGWARVTDGDPCAFCLTLASRGAVYKSEETADFQAHDHCGCTAEPIFPGSALPPGTKRFQEIYDAAQRAGVENGSLQGGENSSSARINAVRRYLAAH